MYRDHTVAVVVPAYNEADHVGAVIEEMPPLVDRIYAVDDASSDGTWETIRRYASGNGTERPEAAPTAAADGGSVDDRVVAIRHPTNRGAGGALLTGYRRALADGVDVTVAMDADGQMDPDYLPALLDPVVEGEADYAKGNRLAIPEHRAEMPRFRLFGNWLLSALTNVASGYWGVRDPQNGYTAISREALSAVDLDAVRTGHDYTNDLLVRLNVAGMDVADVAMPARYGDEGSTITYSQFVPRTASTLVASFLWRLRRRYLVQRLHPVALFYGAGAAGAATGLLAGLDALRRRAGDGPDPASSGDSSPTPSGGAASALASLVSLWFACLLVLVAMALDREAGPAVEDRDRSHGSDGAVPDGGVDGE